MSTYFEFSKPLASIKDIEAQTPIRLFTNDNGNQFLKLGNNYLFINVNEDDEIVNAKRYGSNNPDPIFVELRTKLGVRFLSEHKLRELMEIDNFKVLNDKEIDDLFRSKGASSVKDYNKNLEIHNELYKQETERLIDGYMASLDKYISSDDWKDGFGRSHRPVTSLEYDKICDELLELELKYIEAVNTGNSEYQQIERRLKSLKCFFHVGDVPVM